MHIATRPLSNNNSALAARRSLGRAAVVAILGFACIEVVSSLEEPVWSNTLAQTQLRGLTGVNLYVHVSADLGPIAAEIEKSIRTRSLDLLDRARMSPVAKNQEYLEVDVKAEACGTESTSTMFAVLVSVRLREHVALARDHSLDVPGGGALTWWQERLLTSPEPSLGEAIEKAALEMVEVFTDEVHTENGSARPGSSKGTPK